MSASSSAKAVYEINRSLKWQPEHRECSGITEFTYLNGTLYTRNAAQSPSASARTLPLMRCDANGRQRTRKRNLIKPRPRDIIHGSSVTTWAGVFTTHFPPTQQEDTHLAPSTALRRLIDIIGRGNLCTSLISIRATKE